MTLGQMLEAALAYGTRAVVRALPRSAALMLGARLGGVAHALGVRRAVALDNLARAFPERPLEERRRILAAHYRDLGMMLCEGARGRASTHAPPGEVVSEVRGLEHLEAARQAGRGAIILTGHYGAFGLLGAWLGRLTPLDVFNQKLNNPVVDRMLARDIEKVGIRRITPGPGLRRLITGLRENRWAFMLGDQDAGRHGVFVPFLGRLCSTHPMPAELSLRTGAPIVMAFITRRADERNEIDVLPPLTLEPPDAPDPVTALTALHTAVLERWVRMHPDMWFWLHRRWKTVPPATWHHGNGDAVAAGQLPHDTTLARGA